jgi:hypothetical protein
MITFGLLLAPRISFPQGCVPAHYVSLSLGAQGVSYLNPGQWEGDVSYRYLHSEHVFQGTQERPDLYNVGGRLTINSFDLTATYQVNSRLGLSLTMPFQHADYSTIQGDGLRHTGSAGGLGDLRLLASVWLFDPPHSPNGNLNFGVGVQAPTGDERAVDDYHLAGGSVILRPVDIAAQPGDGGWGFFLQLQGFQEIVQHLYGYISGYYLFNPQDTNGTERPSPAMPGVNTVSDQYLGRIGLSWAVLPSKGLSITLGGRIDGVPVHDAIGDSNGFRRAGYSIYIDPGVNWVFGKNILSINVPVAVERNLQQTSTANVGALADFIVVASFSRQF